MPARPQFSRQLKRIIIDINFVLISPVISHCLNHLFSQALAWYDHACVTHCKLVTSSLQLFPTTQSWMENLLDVPAIRNIALPSFTFPFGTSRWEKWRFNFEMRRHCEADGGQTDRRAGARAICNAQTGRKGEEEEDADNAHADVSNLRGNCRLSQSNRLFELHLI